MRLVKKFAALAIMMALAPLARGQVMDLIPADAGIVFKINKASQVNAKVAKLMTDWGLVQFNADLADPLDHFLSKAGMKNGIDKTGDVAVSLTLPQINAPGAEKPAAPRSREPKGLILVPVSNYDQFLANFQGAPTENGISTIQLPGNPKPHYMAHWGNYAAISNVKEMVAQKPTATLKVASATVNNELNSKDLVMFVNVPQVRTQAKAGLKQFQRMIQQGLNEGVARNPANPYASLTQTTIKEEVNAIQQILDDANAVALSINLSDSGINLAGVADFAPESKVGKIISQIQPTDDSILAGLPAAKYILYGGFKLSPGISQALIDFTKPIVQSMTPGAGENAQLMDAFQKMMTGSESQTFGIVAPTGALGASSLVQGYVINHGDAKTLAEATRNYFGAMATALTPPPQPPATKGANGQANPPPAPPMTMKMEVKENAKQVDGITFNQYTMQMNMNPTNPQEAQAAQALAMLYGPNGLSYWVGIVNDKSLLTVFGSDALAQSAVAGVKANQNVLAAKPSVQAVSSQLPKNRFVVGYFQLDQLLMSIAGYAAQFGFPVNLQIPPDLPPIGIAGATENGTALRGEIHVSSQMVQSLIAAGLQAFQQMQGGRGGPNANPGAL